MNRFDLLTPLRDALNAAVEIGIVDAVEIGCLFANHFNAGVGKGTEALLDELDETADSLRHSDPARRRAWIEIREALGVILPKFGEGNQDDFQRALSRFDATITKHTPGVNRHR